MMHVRSLVLCCVALGKSLPLSEPLFLNCQPPGVGSLPVFVLPRGLVKAPVVPQISVGSSQPSSRWHLADCWGLAGASPRTAGAAPATAR